MKRARDEAIGEEFVVSWITREGRVQGVYPRSFLAKYSAFFQAQFRFSEMEQIEIKLPYPKATIKNLFRHLDGETLNITLGEEALLQGAIDFLILESPFDKIDNQGFDLRLCSWCSKEVDNSICLAKRWIIFNDQQQCAICCKAMNLCDCDWASFKNPHTDDNKWVRNFRRGDT